MPQMQAGTLEAVVAEVLGVPVGEIDDSTGPARGSWTSLQHLKIVAAVQDTWQLKLTPRQIRSVRSVADLRALVTGPDA